MMLIALIGGLLSLISLANGGSTTSSDNGGTVSYPAYPLAVKSPYLSAWMEGTDAGAVSSAKPVFWTTNTKLVWNVMARVTPSGGTSKTYTLFGFPNPPSGAQAASQSGPVSVTATRTQVTLTGGIATFQLEFMSIIDPSNYTIHSLPWSYLTVTASSSSTANIQIFSALGDSWTGQNGATTITTLTQGSTKIFNFYNTGQTAFQESSDQQAAWGSTAYATQPRQGSTVSSNFGVLSSLYSQFINAGNLGSPNSSGPSSTTSGVAFSHSLQSVTSAVKVVFAVGSDRSQAIKYNGGTMTGFYRATFSTVPLAADFFLGYYDQALADMTTFDSSITAMGMSISKNYADILDLGVRQTYGAYELTIPLTTNLSTAVTSIFEKEISSDGNVNSVDSFFPALPLLYLISPGFIRGLIQPVLDFIQTGAWHENFCLHDIGKSYPIATGYTTEVVKPNKTCGFTPEYLPVEVTSSLLLMLAAHAQKLGNTNFASGYKGILTTYADYLYSKGLDHQDCQLSTVDQIGPGTNQTQLGVIATIALGAMGKMFGMSNYTTISQNFASQLLNSRGAFTTGATPHFTYYYNNSTTWSVMFPLFMDSLLGLDLFKSVYQAQSNWYASRMAPSGYGLPYSGGVGDYDWGITDWNFWGAATSSAAVQNMVIDSTHKYLTDGMNIVPFGTKYNVKGAQPGKWVGNQARDTVGANWAIYLLNSLS